MGLTFEQFTKDDKTYDAIPRNLEIIGEAAKHIPDEVSLRYGNVEWHGALLLRFCCLDIHEKDHILYKIFTLCKLIYRFIVRRLVGDTR